MGDTALHPADSSIYSFPCLPCHGQPSVDDILHEHNVLSMQLGHIATRDLHMPGAFRSFVRLDSDGHTTKESNS